MGLRPLRRKLYQEDGPDGARPRNKPGPVFVHPGMTMLTALSRWVPVALLLALAVPLSAAAPPEQTRLFETLAALDAALFDSYNRCDLDKNRTFFADDLEFYHDQGGLTRGADKLTEQLKKNICGKTRRELVPGSLEVHPLKGYGAVQIGVHRFFSPADAKEASGEAKFIHIWRYDNGEWKITRVISYDHKPVEK